MAQFLAELKRRNVFKVATIYVVVSWLVLQVADTVFPIFDIPLWTARLVVILLGLGFPVALILAWAFDLTPEGIKWGVDERPKVDTHAWDWILGILLVTAIGLMVATEIEHWRNPAIGAGTHGPAEPAEVSPAPAVVREHSIAVLPFLNISDDADNEYFSDGLSEEILILLSQIPDLKVIGRTSSFAFKGKSEDLRNIGQTLGVTTLLDGSVRKVGDRVRITAALIDATDGSSIWSDNYNRTLTDIFEVQDDVAAAIIDALEIHVTANPTRGRPTGNSEAYALFLKARIAVNGFNWLEAEALLKEAIELDEAFAEAHELLAYAYSRAIGINYRAADAQQMSFDAAARALAISPDLVLARALYELGDPNTSGLLAQIEALEVAARRRPDDQRILDILFFGLFKAGYLEEALGVAQRIAELEPISPSANGRISAALFSVGRTDEGFASLELFDQLGLEEFWFVGEANLAHGRDRAAVAQFEAYLAQNGYEDSAWVAELISSARDPASGQAYLERRLQEVAAAAPPDLSEDLEFNLRFWYLFFGHLDAYYELIFQHDLNQLTYTDADDLVAAGTAYPDLGFVAHPRYLELAEQLGLVDIWEVRGPPDFCEREDATWRCGE